MANNLGVMSGLLGVKSSSDTSRIPSEILAIMRKRKAMNGVDTTKKVNVMEDVKLVASGKGQPTKTQSQLDSIAAANKPMWEKGIASMGYETAKKKQ